MTGETDDAAPYAVEAWVEVAEEIGSLSALGIEDSSGLCRSVLLAVKEVTGRSLRLAIRFCSDAEMRAAHARYLDDDSSTDVMSFPADPLPVENDGGVSQHGDLLVCVDFARERAALEKNSVHAELALYVAHGALHLCGYDDHEEEDKVQMLRAERQVLDRLRLRVRNRHEG